MAWSIAYEPIVFGQNFTLTPIAAALLASGAPPSIVGQGSVFTPGAAALAFSYGVPQFQFKLTMNTGGLALAGSVPTINPGSNPLFSPPAGNYASAQSVTISVNPPGGVTIYYTSDGTTPTFNPNNLYYTPVTTVASGNETLKAIAYSGENFHQAYSPGGIVGKSNSGNLWVVGGSGAGRGKMPAPANGASLFALYSDQQSPTTGDGSFVVNTWDCSALTGFAPNSRATAQLAYAATGTNPVTIAQYENNTCGAFLNSADLAGTSDQMISAQTFFGSAPTNGLNLFTDATDVLHESMLLQVCTATGTGPWVPVKHFFDGTEGGFDNFDLAVLLFRKTAGTQIGVDNNTNALVLVLPLGTAFANTYVTPDADSAGFQTSPWTGLGNYMLFSYSISRAQVVAALNYLIANAPAKTPPWNFSNDPTQYRITTIHLNAEIQGTLATDTLGWSMQNWVSTMQNATSAVVPATYSIGVVNPSAPVNLQVINQGGPANGPQASYTIPNGSWPFSPNGNSGSGAAANNPNYQGLSWQPATQGTFPIAKYNIYRNGFLYDSVATPISITGSIVPGTDSVGDSVGVFTVSAVSGGASANGITDGKLLPAQFLNSAASGFVAGSRILCYNQNNTSGGGTGSYWVDWSQTASGTFTTWAYNDTASTNCIPFNFGINITTPGASAAGTIYAYSVTAVDSQGGEGPPAYPAMYQYQGISRTGRAQFNYGGTMTWNDTTGSPILGPYDINMVSTGGAGAGSLGINLVWGNGAFGDNSSHSYLGPTQHIEPGAFNYWVFDIKFADTLFQTHIIPNIMHLRSIGLNGGVDGPSPNQPTIDIRNYFYQGGVAVPLASAVANQWYNVKIPLSATPYGICHCTGSFVATGVCAGTLTVTSFQSMTMGWIDSSVMVLANSVSGSAMPANVYTCGSSSGGSTSWTDPTTTGGISGYGTGPWVFHVIGPNIVGNESNSGTYILQASMGYKNGWQYNGASYNGGQGNFFLNNVGFTTV